MAGTEIPAEPNFTEIAGDVVRRITAAPQPKGVTADPIVAAAKIIKVDLEQAYAMGRIRGAKDAEASLPGGSLVYRTKPREHSGATIDLLVEVDEVPRETGTTHFPLFALSHGDRALLRSLCDLMLERLDDTEREERKASAWAEKGGDA